MTLRHREWSFLFALLAAMAAFAVEAGPVTAATRLEPGWSQLLSGQDDEAVAAFGRCLQQDPESLSCAIGLASLEEARGGFDRALEVLVGSLEHGMRGPLAAGVLARIMALAPRTRDGGQRARALLESIAAGRLTAPDPEVRSMALLALADILGRAGEPEAAYRLLREQGGRIEEWTILGPYGRISSLALTRAFPPERGDFRPSSGVASSGGREIERLETRFADGRLVLPPYLRQQGAIYAMTDVGLERPLELRMRVATASSFQVFIDHGLAATADRLRDRPPLAFALKLSLGPGRHRLMVKLAGGNQIPPLAVSLEPLDGAPLGERVRVLPPDGPPQGEASVETMPVGLDQAFFDEPMGDPARLMAGIWWLKARGLDRRVGKLYQQAGRLWPEAPIFVLGRGEFYFRAETGAAPTEDLAQARTLIERSLAGDPQLLTARLLLAQMDRSAGRVTESWENASRALELSPDHPDALLLLYQLAIQRRWLEEAGEFIDRALEEAPGRSDVLARAIDYCRTRGDTKRLRGLLARLHRRNPLDPAWADQLHSAGETDAALAAWEEILRSRESSARAWLGKVRTLEDAGRWQEALGELERARRLFPQAGWLALERAGVEAALDRQKEATTSLRRALDLEPQRLSVRKVLQRRGEPDHLRPWLADPRSILARARPPAPGTDSALLADIAATLIDRHGGQTESYQGIHGVYTRAGVEHEGELTVLPGALVEAIHLHKPDGRVVDVAPGSRRPISLPGLEVGDSIEYIWTRYTLPLNALPGALDNRTVFLFQGEDRDYVLSRFAIVHDEKLPVKACGNQEGLETTDEIIDGQRVRSWTAREMPRQYLEPHIPNRFEITPHIRLGLGLDWPTVGDIFRGALVGKLRLDDPLPEMLDQIRRRAGSSEPEVLARALHQVILQRVRPGRSSLLLNSPASMSASAGEGDRVGIALALARELGLRPDLVFARPIELAGTDLGCPTMQTFPYVLLRIDLGNRKAFLDYTEADHPFDSLPERLAGSDALIVPMGTDAPAAIASLPRRETGVMQEQIATLHLSSDGRVQGTLRMVLRGPFAAVTRRLLREVPKDKMPLVHQSLAGEVYPGAIVDQARISGFDDPEADLVIELEIHGGSLARSTAAGLALPLTTQPLGLLAEYGSLPSRRYALLFAMQSFQHDVVTIGLPEGWSAGPLPPAFDYEGEWGRYHLEARVEKGELVIDRRALFPSHRVEPEEYIDFREFTRAVDDAEEQEIMLAGPRK